MGFDRRSSGSSGAMRLCGGGGGSGEVGGLCGRRYDCDCRRGGGAGAAFGDAAVRRWRGTDDPGAFRGRAVICFHERAVRIRFGGGRASGAFEGQCVHSRISFGRERGHCRIGEGPAHAREAGREERKAGAGADVSAEAEDQRHRRRYMDVVGRGRGGRGQGRRDFGREHWKMRDHLHDVQREDGGMQRDRRDARAREGGAERVQNAGLRRRDIFTGSDAERRLSRDRRVHQQRRERGARGRERRGDGREAGHRRDSRAGLRRELHELRRRGAAGLDLH